MHTLEGHPLSYIIPIMFGIVFLVAFIAGSADLHKGRWVFVLMGISIFLAFTIPQIYAIINT